MLSLYLIIVLIAPFSLCTSEIDLKFEIIKFNFPVRLVNQYKNLLKTYRPHIDELTRPNIILNRDENISWKNGNITAKWLIKHKEYTNEIIAKLIAYEIDYSVKNHLTLKSAITKRDLLPTSRKLFELNRTSGEKIHSQIITKKYFNVKQIYEWMNETTRNNSNFIQMIEIGKSLQNRSLYVLKIGYPAENNRSKKLFWFDSGIHAREWTTISTSLYIIDKIVESQKINGSFYRKFLKYYDIYFMVVVNPDGYDYSLKFDFWWRKNVRNYSKFQSDCFGVDLNRNYGYHWMKTGASSDICTDIYAGTNAGSEPETQAIKNFIFSKSPNWLSFITLHSYGGYWLHHWEKRNHQLTKRNFIRICNKPLYALRAIKLKHNYNYLFGTPGKLLLYDAAGASDAWAMMIANITYSYTIEIGPIEEETEKLDELYFGFHVQESKLGYVIERAYTGIEEYMRSFIEKIDKTLQIEIDKKCSQEYNELINNFSGYWNF